MHLWELLIFFNLALSETSYHAALQLHYKSGNEFHNLTETPNPIDQKDFHASVIKCLFTESTEESKTPCYVFIEKKVC